MKDLNKWFSEKNINADMMQSFECALSAYKSEEPDEYKAVFFDGAPILPQLETIHHVYALPEFSNEQIYVELSILFHEKKVGWYRKIYNIDGTAFDDYFVID